MEENRQDCLLCPNLKDKVCVITGGGGVIGATIAWGLASAGANIVVLGRTKDRADETALQLAETFGVKAIGVAGDVLNKASLIAAREEIHRHMGNINCLVNCAGGNSPKATTQLEILEKEDMADLSKTFLGLDLEEFQNVMDLNFMGTVLPIMAFIPDMIELSKGSILNVSSMGAFKPLTKIPAYSAAKASINNFTEWLAIHFAKVHVRVNAIAPGFFLTQQNRYLLIDEHTGEYTARAKKILGRTPMGTFGDPKNLCGAVLYLLSDMSEFVTGVVIPVDGGFNAYSGV